MATVIHVDNQGCIALASNPVFHSQEKHIDIWHYFIWGHIEQNEINLVFVSTKQMLAGCYETVPKEETISYTFINLMGNIQKYNAGKI